MTLVQLAIMVNQQVTSSHQELVTNVLLVDAGAPGEYLQIDLVSLQGMRRRVRMALSDLEAKYVG